MDLLWFLRMSNWVRHPPGRRKLIVGAVTLVLCLALYALDRYGLWPVGLRVNPRHWKP